MITREEGTDGSPQILPTTKQLPMHVVSAIELVCTSVWKEWLTPPHQHVQMHRAVDGIRDVMA